MPPGSARASREQMVAVEGADGDARGQLEAEQYLAQAITTSSSARRRL